MNPFRLYFLLINSKETFEISSFLLKFDELGRRGELPGPFHAAVFSSSSSSKDFIDSHSAPAMLAMP